MTSERDFKKLVRERAAQTGERYTEARAALRLPIAGASGPSTPPPATAQDAAHRFSALYDRLTSVVIGKDEVVRLLLIAAFSRSAVVFEDVAGTARSLLIRVLARSIGARHAVVRGAPDTPPDALRVDADIIEVEDLYFTSDGFRGALYDALEPGGPFVVAHLNPVTPREALRRIDDRLLDRFLFKLVMGYPDPETEVRLTSVPFEDEATRQWEPLMSVGDVHAVAALATTVSMPDDVSRWIVEVVGRMRRDPDLVYGPSPRASRALARAAATAAAVTGRTEVSRDDVAPMLGPALGHRMHMTHGAVESGSTVRDILARVTA